MQQQEQSKDDNLLTIRSYFLYFLLFVAIVACIGG